MIFLYLHKKATQQDNQHKSLLYLIENMTMVKNVYHIWGPKIWNKIYSEIKEATNSNTFKHRVKDKFFKDLKEQEDSIYKY
jgi:long-subunit acyl-CoA synthetase (AMP-forming)